ncbi:ABC transporter ATP-binding protein [Actinobacillus equuli]|nr:ABC transporter ATP-binding protein [Actinobacillus equuli]
MVFISHDLQTVHQVSDRIVVMNGGKVVETGSSSEVFNSPKEEYTRTLINAAPSLL